MVVDKEANDFSSHDDIPTFTADSVIDDVVRGEGRDQRIEQYNKPIVDEVYEKTIL